IAQARQGQYDLAISDCTKALSLDPNNVEALGLRGTIYEMRTQYDLAIVDLGRAIRLQKSWIDRVRADLTGSRTPRVRWSLRDEYGEYARSLDRACFAKKRTGDSLPAVCHENIKR